MKSRHKQQGMTAISIMMLLALIGFNLMVIVKLLPSYLDSFKVATAVKGLASDDRVEAASDEEVKNIVLKKLAIDDIEDLGNDDIFIEKTRLGRTISIEFERRVPMFGNLDAVVVFSDDEVELR